MNPFRIIIDVWGEDSSTVASRSGPAVVLPKNGKMPPGALAKQLALGVRRIVVDPGHGGKDPGALGYLKGVREKDITLSISKKVSKKLQEQLGYEVLMTRSRDVYLTLEERTAFANTKNADLFISIHTNAHRNRDAYGMETYFLNLATDDDAIRVAAMENATSAKNISDLQTILSDLMQNAKINESSRLAASVQTAMYGKLKGKYKSVKNLGVKQAPFYVLLGAQMPAILVETSFISNPRECKRLVDPRYQDHLADAIVAGVQRYIREMQPSASFRPPPRDHS
jgi:N-acetylmuramoyl-L-alanine amidase